VFLVLAQKMLITLISKDFRNEEIGELLHKHYKAGGGWSADDRLRACRLIENMTAGAALVESMHGAEEPGGNVSGFNRP